MPAVTITDLENAALDLLTLGAIANSEELSVVDRLGQTRPTMTALEAEYPLASANAASALSSKNAAAASETNATAAKVAAESARDAANAVGKVFTSTALGIAGTTSGQSFSVLSADLLSLIIYTNAAGTATELLRFRTKAFLDSLGFDTTYASRVGYAAAWLDAANNLALGIRNDGRIIFGYGGDLATRMDAGESAIVSNAASVTTRLAALPTQNDATFLPRCGYVMAWEDSAGNLAGGLDAAGNLITKGKNINDVLLGGGGYERSGYVWGVVDSLGRIPLGLDVAGNLLIKGIAFDASSSAAIAVIQKWITPSGFWWYGDSLSASGAPAWLAGYLGKTVTVGAVGGQTAQQVAARFGGQVPLFTVTGNTIPASGGVAVTARTIELITAQNTGSSWTGKLAGIAGTYTSDASSYGTFTRTVAGSALVIDPATPFLIDIADQRMFGTVVLWYGRNNVGSGSFNADVKAAIADSIAQLKTQDQRFVVLSVLNWPGETTGGAAWTSVETLNADLKALYPRNYVDVLNLLRRSGDGSANDIADAASGIIPRSLRNSSSDGHLNNTTGNPIVATRVFQFLTEKGWTV